MATVYAVSTSLADVTTAVNAATSGDTVIIPDGDSTWGARLEPHVGITLQGQGVGNTIIRNGHADVDDYLVAYIPSNPELNEPFRVTGLTMDGLAQGSGVCLWNCPGTPTLAKIVNRIRVDHCAFQNCMGVASYWHGLAFGVMDNCSFLNCNKLASCNGFDWYTAPDYPPYLPIDLGGPNCPTFEDCVFTWTASMPTNGSLITGGWAGRYRMRHCTVQIANMSSFWPQLLDAHGNLQPVELPYAPGGSRGMVFFEVYDNDINCDDTGGWQFLDHRGGQGIVYNNRLTGDVDIGDVSWSMREEDKPGDLGFRTIYPGYDPHTGSYCWGNKYNEAAFNPQIIGTVEDNTTDAFWIQEERDYHLHAPAVEVYSAYPYPHSLRGGSEYGFAGNLAMILK